MVYSADIDALSPDHRWSFDNTLNDQIGSANGVSNATSFALSPICEDVTNSLTTTARSSRVTIPDTVDINSSNQTRKCVCGWYMVSTEQLPPCRIYGEGNEIQSFSFSIGYGNNIIFEVDDPNFTIQIYSKVALAKNRAYHLCMIFEGNGFGNKLRAYIDGVEQLNSVPVDRSPNSSTLTSRTPVEFGDPVGTVALGGTEIVLVSSVVGTYNEWASWNDAPAVLTDTQIRRELFEKGAIPNITITADTEINMQAQLSALANTTVGNYPLCIRVEESTDGNLTLVSDNIIFDELASIHLQYIGSNTLTWKNINGSNTSILSSIGSGSIVLVNVVPVTIKVVDILSGSPIVGARVYLEAGVGGDILQGTQIRNSLTDGLGEVSFSFDYTSDQPILGRVRKSSSQPFYKTGEIVGSIQSTGFSQISLLVPDE